MGLPSNRTAPVAAVTIPAPEAPKAAPATMAPPASAMRTNKRRKLCISRVLRTYFNGNMPNTYSYLNQTQVLLRQRWLLLLLQRQQQPRKHLPRLPFSWQEYKMRTSLREKENSY